LKLRYVFQSAFVILFVYILMEYCFRFDTGFFFFLYVIPAALLTTIIGSHNIFIAIDGGIYAFAPLGLYLFYGLLVAVSVFVPLIWDKYISKE
jgi:hypothetical protein